MQSKSSDTNVLKWLLGAAALVVIIAGVRAAQSLVVPLLVAAFLAVICTPALQWLQRKGVPTALALLLVLGGMSSVCLIVGVIAGASIHDFVEKSQGYQEKLTVYKDQLLTWLEGIGVEVPEEGEENLFSTRRLVGLFASFLGNISGLFSNAFLILLTLLFMLLEASGLPRKLLALADGRAGLFTESERIRDAIIQYVSLKTSLSLLTGVLVAALVKVLGVDYPVLWGLLAFFFNFVPNIGSILAAVPAILLALIQTDLKTTMLTAVGYLIINVCIGNFLEPRIMGKGLGLSTLVVFVSLVFWGWVLGPVGMLLSVPLTMIVKITLENFEQTHWIAVLLSANPEPGK